MIFVCRECQTAPYWLLAWSICDVMFHSIHTLTRGWGEILDNCFFFCVGMEITQRNDFMAS